MMVYQPETIALVFLLIAAFLVAFTVLKMLMETATVGLISGIFYLGMVTITNQSFSIQSALTYSFLGVILYMAYSLIASTFKLTSDTLSSFSRTFKFLGGLVTGLTDPLSDLIKDQKQKLRQKTSDLNSKERTESEEDSEVKEVILGENEND